MPAFVSRGLTDHSLRIGVIPSAVRPMAERELRAALLRDLERVLVPFVAAEIVLVSQEEEKTLQEWGERTTGKCDADNQQSRSQDG